jgi:hypothetical protein
MDYNDLDDNVENSKRCTESKDSLHSDHTTLQPGSEEYYAENRILIPELDTVSLTFDYTTKQIDGMPNGNNLNKNLRSCIIKGLTDKPRKIRDLMLYFG